MTERYHRWRGRKLGEQCVKSLKGRGYDAILVPSAEAAVAAVLERVAGCETFGLGGSVTLRSLGLIEELKVMGKTVYDHWEKGLAPDAVAALRRRHLTCDCFLCSVNAVTVDGDIVNVDGIGNRVSAMVFGPGRVILVAGVNKIVRNLDAALARCREVAAPMRAKSLGLDTPCGETGYCVDCKTSRRICNVTTILHRRPQLTETSVVLVNERLGF